MSHHLYDPFAPDDQSSTQGQYGLSGMQERDPRRLAACLRPEPSFSSSGASSATPTNSGGMVPPMMTQSVGYRPEQTRVDENLQRSVDMHISRAREEARFLGHPDHQLVGHSAHFASSQRVEYKPSDTRTSSYSISSTSASQAHRHSDVGSSISSMDWLSSFKRPAIDDSAQCYAPPASSYSSSSDCRFTAPTEREHDLQSIPGLRDYPAPDKADPTDTSRPKYTSQTASDILSRFGLEKEDLEYLITYPEDQLTPTNLPFILRQIRVEKAKRSDSSPDPQAVGSARGMDSFSSSAGSSAVLLTPKVIDYGHTGKYGVLEDIGRNNNSRVGEQCPSSSQEPPRKDISEIKISTMVSSCDQSGTVTSLSSAYNSVTSPSKEPPKRLQTQPNQTSLPGFQSFNLPKKDTDRRVFTASKPLPFKEPEAETRPKLPLPFPVLQSGNPGRCGLVLVDKTYNSGAKGASKTPGQDATVPKQMTKAQKKKQGEKQKQQQKQKQLQKQKQQEKPKQQQKQEEKQKSQNMQKEQTKKPVQPFWTAVYPPVPPAPVIPSALVQFPGPLFFAGGAPPPGHPPPLLQQNTGSAWKNFHFLQQRLVKVPGVLPTPAMMQDYAAASPKVFPHTCSLCFTQCKNMQDWISHQNTSLHLESCRYLRILYSKWNGEIVLKYSAAGKDATSVKNSQKSQRKSSHGSRSRSRSLSSHRGRRLEGRRDKRSRSRSRSSRNSRSRSCSPYYNRHRSRSRSRKRRQSSEERRPSPGRTCDRRSSPRREDRRFSPTRSDERRSSSRNRNRRSSARSEERWSSSGRSEDRRPSPRRSRERRSSPRRREDRRSPPRSEDKRSSPKRSQERRTTTERSSSAEKLVKKLLQKTANQSLSKESDLEAMVKTLLAEINKKNPSSSSSSAKRKQPKSSTSAAAKSLTSAAASSSLSSSSAAAAAAATMKETMTTTAKTSLQKTKLAKTSSQTMVKLEGIVNSLSHSNVVAAVERFGKTKSVVLFRKQKKAHVFFEKAQDAQKLNSIRVIDVNGISLAAGPLTVRKKETIQQKTPLKKLGNVSVSKLQTAKATNTTKTALTRKPGLLPTPTLGLPIPVVLQTQGLKKAKKITTGKCLKKKAVKPSVKGLTSVTKAKVLVYRAKNVPKSPEHVSKRIKPVMRPKWSAAAGESANVTQIRVPETIAELKVKVESVSPSQDTETPVEKFTVKEGMEEVTAEPGNVLTTSDSNRPDAETSKLQESIKVEPNLHQLMAAPDDLVQVEMGKVAVSEEKQRAEPAKAKVKAEGAQYAEPMDVEGKGRAPEASEPMENQPPTRAYEIGSDLSAVETPAGSPQDQGLKTDSASTVKFQKALESTEVSSKVTGGDQTISCGVATSDKMAPGSAAVNKQPAAADPSLTIGEQVQTSFDASTLGRLSKKNIMSPKFCKRPAKMILITNLPTYGSYTEEDVAKLLTPFGFVYEDENIYVAPHMSLAFFVLPSAHCVRFLVRFTSNETITLNNCELGFAVTNCDFSMIPLHFYRLMMKRMKVTSTSPEDATRIVYVKNISPSEIKVLREDLRMIDQVKNIFPLLNKVFVEFETTVDADRLGVWYSLLKNAPGYRIYRLKIPKCFGTAPLPKFPLKAIPDGNSVTAVVPSLKYGVPVNSTSPFWVTLATRPFVFPTLSAWFIIPKFLTVKTRDEVLMANNQFFRTPTVMFTGLPQGHYKHEDVARLVWSYFPKQTLQSLYYRVTVLTLQRRAFVRFHDWVTCCKFVRDHIQKPIFVRDSRLNIHFIFENVLMESTEELMYRSLMKLSNSRVPDCEALEERLLCVEISEASVNIVTVVLEVVASIAPFLSFLPLANRICVEMADASGVADVVEKYQSFSPDSEIRRTTWEKVVRFETLTSLKQRLEDNKDVTINLEQEPSQTEAPAADTPVMEDATKTTCSVEGNTVPESPTASKEKPAESPQVDQDVFTTIKAVLQQYKTSRGRGSKAKDVHTDLQLSESYLSEVDTFNMDDFVTVDEVGTDRDPPPSSSSRRSHRTEREQQSSYKSARSRSTPSARSTKKSLSSSSYKPKEVSTKRSLSSLSTSTSQKKAKHFPEPTKSTTKTSSSSSLRSPDSSSSSDTKTKSQVKAANASWSSSYAAHEREKELASPPESQSAGPQSDHTVSAEGTAAKSVESETKTETSAEMHSPAQAQGSGLSQIQNVEIGYKDRAVKDLEDRKDDLQRNSKEEEEEEEDGNYQVLDSFEEQPENQIDDDDPQPETDESFQVFDSIADERSPKKCSEGVTEDPVKDDSEVKPASEDLNNENHHEKNQNRMEEKPDPQIINHGDPPCEDKDNVKEHRQELFEIVDHSQNLAPRSDRVSEDVIVLTEDEEDDTYQVVDSVEDQATAMTTESDNKRKRRSKVETRSPCRSRWRTRARKQDKETTAKEEQETDGVNEVYEVIDCVDDDPVQGASTSERSSRRRSARGKKQDLLERSKKPDADEKVTKYEILDSVEEDNVTEAHTVPTRSTRGRRERSNDFKALIDLTKTEDTQTRRRRTTPARETPKKDVEPQKEGTPTKKSDIAVREADEEDATYQIVDSVEDEVVKDERPTERGRRGRPKKEKEEVSYQILDSVEEETVDDPPLAEQPKSTSETGVSENDEKLKEESAELPKEEEPVYQIVDSVEEDQVQEELANKTGDEISPKVEEPSGEEETMCSTSVVEATENVVYGLEEVSDASSAEDDFGLEGSLKSESNSGEGSRRDARNYLVNLDEVSDEEEDYPDDTAEEEELKKKRAAAVEEKKLPKEQGGQRGKRRTREKKEEGRRSRERERRSSSGGGGGGRSSDERRRRVKDVEELVTLDEVVVDEAREEAAAMQNLELQELVTLDEILEDEEEEDKVEGSKQKNPPPNKEDEPVDSLNIETLDEAGVHQDEKAEERQKSESVKRKHEPVDESADFVTVDEVGGVEEVEEKAAPRTRGRPKKKTKKTPVRKSARGKKVATDKREEEAPPPPPDLRHAVSSPDKDLSTLQSEARHESQKTEEEACADAPSAGQELQSENQSLEEDEEKTPAGSVDDIRDVRKRRRKLLGPEAKRSRSQSPSVSVDVKLPPFNADDSYGREFVIPRQGYFCNLCRVFYVNESDTKDAHCSSREHYDNLQNHLQKLQNKPSWSSAENFQGSVSD